MKTEHRKGNSGNGMVRMTAILGALLWLAGCQGPNALEQDFGRSVANNIAQQVVNPQAGYDATPAVGLPPLPGVYEMERYDKSFKGEEKKPMEMKLISGF